MLARQIAVRVKLDLIDADAFAAKLGQQRSGSLILGAGSGLCALATAAAGLVACAAGAGETKRSVPTHRPTLDAVRALPEGTLNRWPRVADVDLRSVALGGGGLDTLPEQPAPEVAEATDPEPGLLSIKYEAYTDATRLMAACPMRLMRRDKLCMRVGVGVDGRLPAEGASPEATPNQVWNIALHVSTIDSISPYHALEADLESAHLEADGFIVKLLPFRHHNQVRVHGIWKLLNKAMSGFLSCETKGSALFCERDQFVTPVDVSDDPFPEGAPDGEVFAEIDPFSSGYLGHYCQAKQLLGARDIRLKIGRFSFGISEESRAAINRLIALFPVPPPGMACSGGYMHGPYSHTHVDEERGERFAVRGTMDRDRLVGRWTIHGSGTLVWSGQFNAQGAPDGEFYRRDGVHESHFQMARGRLVSGRVTQDGLLRMEVRPLRKEVCVYLAEGGHECQQADAKLSQDREERWNALVKDIPVLAFDADLPYRNWKYRNPAGSEGAVFD